MYKLSLTHYQKNLIMRNIALVEYALSDNWTMVFKLINKESNIKINNLNKFYKNNLLFVKNLKKLTEKDIFSKKELGMISFLCDSCSRLEMGQVENFISFLNQTNDNKWLVCPDDREIDDIKRQVFNLDWNQYLSILNPELSKEAQVNCEIHQTIRHFLAWKQNPKGGWTVDFDEPLPITNEKNPTITEL